MTGKTIEPVTYPRAHSHKGISLQSGGFRRWWAWAGAEHLL